MTNRHDRWLLLFVSALFVGYGSLRCNVLAINFTQSEPRGLYLVGSAMPKVGRMVMLRPLMKHAIAGPGDTVAWTPRGIYVNGSFVENSAPPKEQYGYQLKPFGVYQLAPGQWWLMGTGTDSWDSRFIGPVPWDVIATQIHPLLTWR